MRDRLDENRIRKAVFETGNYYTAETLAISANVTLVEGGPAIVALDPGNSARNVVLYTPAATALVQDLEIINISTGTGVLTVQQSDAATSMGTLSPGQRGWLYWNPKLAAWQMYTGTALGKNTVASQQVQSLYTTLALLTNTDVIEQAIPFAFTLLSIGVRIKRPATTAAKAATLTAQVNGVSVTGGVVSLTSANATPTGALVAGTAITAGNTGTAGQTAGAVVSAVTAFLEGDGYLEMALQNTSLLA